MVKIAKLEKAYRENPDTPMFAQLADSYLDQGSVAQALKLCEEGCEKFPDYPTGFTVLSRCYEAQDKLEDARQAMDHALRLDPDNPGGYFQLSQLYESLGIGTLALKSLQQAASLDPFNDYLVELVEELAAAVGDASEEAEPATDASDEPSAAEVPATDLAASASLGDLDLEVAAQAVMQDYPDAAAAEPAQAVEIICLGETAAEVDVGSGAVELISFDDEEWEEDPTASGAIAESPPDADTLFEYETQDVVAAASAGPEGDADLIDLFHEIEGHPGTAEPPAAEAETVVGGDDKGATTETLAQIYASQGLIQRAVDTYRQLLEHDPDNAHLRQQLAELEQQSDETV